MIMLRRSPRAAVATVADKKKSENERTDFMVRFIKCKCGGSRSAQSGSGGGVAGGAASSGSVFRSFAFYAGDGIDLESTSPKRGRAWFAVKIRNW